MISLVLSIFCVSGSYVQSTAEEENTCDSNYTLEDLKEQAMNYYDVLNENVGIIIDKYDNSDIDYKEKAKIYSIEEKIQTFNAISEIYESADESEQQLLTEYVELYANATDNEELQLCYNDLFNTASESTQYLIQSNKNDSYNPTSAINYAYKYYDKYNSNYKNFNSSGGDCVNFVSQCLKAGGCKTSSDWYYSSSADYSASWIKCSKFKSFWTDNSNATYVYSMDIFKKYYSSLKNYMNLQIGDVIMLCERVGVFVLPYHTIIISSISTSDILYSAHNNDCFNKSLFNNVPSDDTLFFIDIKASTYK
jgi:hypothetical protein